MTTAHPPVVYGGGDLHPPAAAAAAAAAPHAALAALPPNHVAVLGQSPAVFKPPTPARYALTTGADGGAALTIDGRPVDCTVARVRTGAGGHTIVCARVAAPVATRRTVLLCHASEVDLAAVVSYYGEIFKDAGVNLISFDYSGYGASGGAPSFRGAAADAAAALEWTRTAHGLSAADIVIYGQSLGTGPAVVLAARTPGIAGLILHSGTTGALRRRDEKAAAASPTDPAAGLTLAWSPHPDEGIPVAGLLAKTTCPLLIVHGTDDKTNLHAESQALAAVGGAARTTFFSAVGHGHDDVETRCAGYGPAVRAFLGRAFDAAAAAVSEA